jgi:hypothetical protein
VIRSIDGIFHSIDLIILKHCCGDDPEHGRDAIISIEYLSDGAKVENVEQTKVLAAI